MKPVKLLIIGASILFCSIFAQTTPESAEIRKLRQQLQTLCDSHQQTVRRLEQQVSTQAHELGKVRTENLQLRFLNQKLVNQLHVEDSLYSSVREGLLSNFQVTVETAEQLREEQAELVNELKTIREEQHDQRANWQYAQDSLMEHIAALEAEKGEVLENQTAITERQDSLEQVYSNLQEQLIAEQNARTHDLGKNQRLVNQLQRDRHRLSEEIERLQMDLEVVREKNGRLKDEIVLLTDARSSILDKLNSCKKASELAQIDAKEKRGAVVDSMDFQLAVMQDSIGQIYRQHSKIRKQWAYEQDSLQEQFDRSQQHIDSLHKVILAKHEEQESLTERLLVEQQRLDSFVQSRRQQTDSMRYEIESLRRMVSVLNGDETLGTPPSEAPAGRRNTRVTYPAYKSNDVNRTTRGGE